MTTGDDKDQLAPRILTMQIIVGSLTMGVGMFLLLVLFVLRPVATPKPFLTYMAAVFAAVLLPMSVLMPRFLVATARKRSAKGTATDPLDLLPLFQTQLIVGAAMNEGAAFFAVIAYFLEGQALALGLAVVLILGIVLRFPTRARVEQWLDVQQQRIEQEKQFGG